MQADAMLASLTALRVREWTKQATGIACDHGSFVILDRRFDLWGQLHKVLVACPVCTHREWRSLTESGSWR
jgi:hypothetical protein